MRDPIFLHRLQFAFTILYHYLFPVLTMGLAFLIAVGTATSGVRRLIPSTARLHALPRAR